MTDLEIVKKWEDATSGQSCGCPTCAQNLLDEMGPRFRFLVLQREETKKKLQHFYTDGVVGLSNPGTTVRGKENIPK